MYYIKDVRYIFCNPANAYASRSLINLLISKYNVSVFFLLRLCTSVVSLCVSALGNGVLFRSYNSLLSNIHIYGNLSADFVHTGTQNNFSLIKLSRVLAHVRGSGDLMILHMNT